MIDSSSLIGEASSTEHRDEPISEILDLEPLEPRDWHPNILPQSKSIVTPPICGAILVPSPQPPENRPDPQANVPSLPGRGFDVVAELDSLSASLKSTDPNGIDPETEWTSISETLATIAAAAPISHSQQLLEELRAAREQILLSHNQLQFLERENRDRANTVDTSLLEVKQLKFRTQQLARHSKNQIEKVREMLVSLEQIRTEVIAGLDKFGGYDEIHSMLAELSETRHSLILAHDRLKTGQEAFYESLQAMGEQITATSHDAEAKLLNYQESISHLSQEISVERIKIGMMSTEMDLKLTQLVDLDTNVSVIHSQIVDKSQTLQSSISKMEREFAKLAQSVQKEKEQFYELTAEMIHKVESLRLQFVDVTKQNEFQRQTIEQLKTDINSIRHNISYEAEQQLDRFDRHYDETIATYGELQARQKASTRDSRRFYNWLWLLTFAVGVVFVLLITVLLTIR